MNYTRLCYIEVLRASVLEILSASAQPPLAGKARGRQSALSAIAEVLCTACSGSYSASSLWLRGHGWTSTVSSRRCRHQKFWGGRERGPTVDSRAVVQVGELSYVHPTQRTVSPTAPNPEPQILQMFQGKLQAPLNEPWNPECRV